MKGAQCEARLAGRPAGLNATMAMLTRLPNSLEYIQEVAGCRTVPVRSGPGTRTRGGQTLMTVNEFISKYIRNEVC